jgi:hypothetical protein
MATVALQGLETFESVNLYAIEEVQLIIEHDSPAPGAMFTIAEKRAIYEFFPSEAEARKHIQNLRERYQRKNPTLKLITKGPVFEESGPWLAGRVDHKFSHSFKIYHSVEYQVLPTSGLPKNLETLLNNPRRRIIEDMRDYPRYPAFAEIPEPDWDKISLF